MRLTDRNVRTLPRPQDVKRLDKDGNPRDAIIHYDDLPGFGLRITQGNARSFVYSYRARKTGQPRRITIGTAGDGSAWTVDLAREQAKEYRRQVELGGDPMQDRRDDIAAPDCNQLFDRYLAEWAINKRTGDHDRRTLAYWVRDELGKMKVADVRHEHIVTLFNRVSKTSKYSANRVHSLLRKIFNLALVWEWRLKASTDPKVPVGNPAQGIVRNPEHQRRRYLDGDELSKLLAMLERRKGQQTADAIWLLLHTGARRGELLRSEWSHFNFRTGRWSKPSHLTKTKVDVEIPLSTEVLAYLVEMRERQKTKAKKAGEDPSPFLFPARNGEHDTQTELKKYWASMIREAGITEHVRLHDLRHTYASILISRGVPLQVIGPLLSHSQISTTLRYSHLADDVLRQATQQASKAIAEAKSQKPKAEVHQLRKGKSRKGGSDAA